MAHATFYTQKEYICHKGHMKTTWMYEIGQEAPEMKAGSPNRDAMDIEHTESGKKSVVTK